MGQIDQYLDLGYTGIVRMTQSDSGETVVCRDRRKQCMRLIVSWTDVPGQDQRLKIERMEIISESRYQKAIVEYGGILDTEAVHQARNRRRMASIAAQHRQTQSAPACPKCGQRMDLAPTRDRWLCATPSCNGRK